MTDKSAAEIDGTEAPKPKPTMTRKDRLKALFWLIVIGGVIGAVAAAATSHSKSVPTTTSPAQGASTYHAFLKVFNPLVSQYIADSNACSNDLANGVWNSLYNHCSNVSQDGSNISYNTPFSGNAALDTDVSALGTDVTTLGNDASNLTSTPTSANVATITADSRRVDADIAKIRTIEQTLNARYGS